MIEIFLAFVADLWIGDPVYALHPVRLMGKGIEKGEAFIRRWIKNNSVGGFILAILFPFSVFGIVAGLITICYQIHVALGYLINIYGIYTAISIHDLKMEAKRIYEDLKEEDIVKARGHLSRIVGRDTSHLDEGEITRATVETVAESTVDGIIAPLFYAAIGGAPLALAYKAVNTLDSMIGHKNERYKEFGYFAAKIDDGLNWLPARLSYSFICIATILTQFNLKSAVLSGGKELRIGNSISNLPEATFAGALQIRLGGTSVYQGRVDKKPFLGSEQKTFEPKIIINSIRLMLSSAWVALGFCLLIKFFLNRGIG